MVLVHHDAVVVLTTGVTATSRVLAVLANTTVTGRHVPPLLAVLLELCSVYKPRAPHVSVTLADRLVVPHLGYYGDHLKTRFLLKWT